MSSKSNIFMVLLKKLTITIIRIWLILLNDANLHSITYNKETLHACTNFNENKSWIFVPYRTKSFYNSDWHYVLSLLVVTLPILFTIMLNNLHFWLVTCLSVCVFCVLRVCNQQLRLVHQGYMKTWRFSCSLWISTKWVDELKWQLTAVVLVRVVHAVLDMVTPVLLGDTLPLLTGELVWSTRLTI